MQGRQHAVLGEGMETYTGMGYHGMEKALEPLDKKEYPQEVHEIGED